MALAFRSKQPVEIMVAIERPHMDVSVPTKKHRKVQPIEVALHPAALLRIETIEALSGQSRSTIYAMVKAGTFPRQAVQSPKFSRWRAADVVAWLEAVGKDVA